MPINILHLSDLHFAEKTHKWVSRAIETAFEESLADTDLLVISGDTFDHALRTHEKSVDTIAALLARASRTVPVLVLAGTYSHDAPGALDYLRHKYSIHEIHVSSVPERLYLVDDPYGEGRVRFVPEGRVTPDDQLSLAVCCLPSLNRALPAIQEIGASAWTRGIFDGWAPRNVADRRHAIPSIVVTHGTVTGCMTESKHAMVSVDHEFSPEVLAAADAEAVLLGHIHKHQSWSVETPSGITTEIVYAGSLVRLVFGQMDETGYIFWRLEPEDAQWEFCPVESRHLLDVEFTGEPDLKRLRELAASVGEDDFVRVRYLADEVRAKTVDKDEIRKLFDEAGGVQIEGQIRPIQSIRAPGIASTAPGVEAKFTVWAETEQHERARLPRALAYLSIEDEIDEAVDLTDAVRESYVKDVTPEA